MAQRLPVNESRPVRVFVRLPNDRDRSRRELSFYVPNGMDSRVLLDAGYTLDGKQAVIVLTEEDDYPVLDQLRDTELQLAEMLAHAGHSVLFQ